MVVRYCFMDIGSDVNIRDQVVAILGLLETAERHLGAGDVLLWVLEILELFAG